MQDGEVVYVVDPSGPSPDEVSVDSTTPPPRTGTGTIVAAGSLAAAVGETVVWTGSAALLAVAAIETRRRCSPDPTRPPSPTTS